MQNTHTRTHLFLSVPYRTYLATALRDGAEDVHHLLEHLPLAGELAVHVVVQEHLHEAVGGLEPSEKLVQHRDAP